MPWIHFHVTQEGYVTPCCQAKWDKELAFGDVNAESIHQIWNGKKINSFRKVMLKGDRDVRCTRCYTKEDEGADSFRNITNKKYQEDVLKIANSDVKSYVQPIYLDIRFSNKCNLRCRICGPWSSSNWSRDYALLKDNNKYQDEVITYGINDSERLMDEFRSLTPNLNQIYFAGGEPLLIEQNYQILDLLIAANRIDVELFYNSNATILNLKGRYIIDYWKKFNQVTFSASIDDFGQPFEFQRKNANWDVVQANLRTIQQECPHVKILITPTVSIYNIFHLPEFHRIMVAKNIIPPQNFIPSMLIQPLEYNIQILPTNLKMQIKDNLEFHLNWLKSVLSFENEIDSYCFNQFKSIITFMFAQDKNQDWHKLVSRETALDHIRSESFVKVFPEYAEYFDNDK